MEKLQIIWEFILDYWIPISAGLLELSLRLWPTEKDRSIVNLVFRVFNAIIPNRKKTLTIAFLFMLTAPLFAQLNGNFKSVRFVNVLDSTTVLPIEATIYYNEQSKKFRCYVDGQWVDCITVSGGGGGSIPPVTHGLTNNGDSIFLGGNFKGEIIITGDDSQFSLGTDPNSNHWGWSDGAGRIANITFTDPPNIGAAFIETYANGGLNYESDGDINIKGESVYIYEKAYLNALEITQSQTGFGIKNGDFLTSITDGNYNITVNDPNYNDNALTIKAKTPTGEETEFLQSPGTLTQRATDGGGSEGFVRVRPYDIILSHSDKIEFQGEGELFLGMDYLTTGGSDYMLTINGTTGKVNKQTIPSGGGSTGANGLNGTTTIELGGALTKNTSVGGFGSFGLELGDNTLNGPLTTLNTYTSGNHIFTSLDAINMSAINGFNLNTSSGSIDLTTSNNQIDITAGGIGELNLSGLQGVNITSTAGALSLDAFNLPTTSGTYMLTWDQTTKEINAQNIPSGGGSTGANGLNGTTTIELGGALNKNTNITGNFGLSFGTTGSRINTASIYTNGAVTVNSSNNIGLTATGNITATAGLTGQASMIANNNIMSVSGNFGPRITANGTAGHSVVITNNNSLADNLRLLDVGKISTGNNALSSLTYEFLETAGTAGSGFGFIKSYGLENSTGTITSISQENYYWGTINTTPIYEQYVGNDLVHKIENTMAGGAVEQTLNGIIIMPNLPTACGSLPTGTLWNDLGTLKVCP